jgi:GDP-4-dehydro-6-deoxy-D-mannose reductase
MKALVTGGSGFVGKHLVALLESQGYKVFSFDMRDGYDIRDYELVRNVLDKVRPSKIFHLAAQAYVPESTANPTRTFEINLLGSTNLLDNWVLKPVS